jgi:hypothetical protein
VIFARDKLFPPVAARVIIPADDGVQERDQDGHSALDQEKGLDPRAGAVGEYADEKPLPQEEKPKAARCN